MISRTAAWATLFLVGTDLFVISPLLPGIRSSLDVSVSAAAWTVTVFSLAYVAGGPVLGSAGDRAGHRRVLIAALGLFAAANLLTAMASAFPVLLAARAAAGLAASGITPTIYALTGASAPAGQRARWLATVTSGLLLALATGAPSGSLLAARLGWHVVFAILAGGAVIVLVAVTAITSPARHRRHARPHATRRASPAGAGMPQPMPGVPARLRAVAVTGLWALAVYGLYTYLGTVLATLRHFRSGVVAASLVCYGLGAVAGNLAGGWLSDRRSPRCVSVLGLLALAAVQVLLGLAIHARAALVLALLGAFALAGYPFFPAQQARLAAGFTAGTGTILAWNSSAMYIGILLGSLAGAPVLTNLGPAALAYAAAGVALAGATVAATRLAGEAGQRSPSA